MNVDVLIVGAGPAGMAAALAAAASNAKIAILDDNPQTGGQIWRDGPQAHLPAVARRYRQQLLQQSNIQLLAGTRVVAVAGPNSLLLEDAERGWVIQYDKLILCTGARELLLPFPGWTLPGVTGAGGLQALIKGGLAVKGQRLVIAGSGPLLLASAATAKDNGANLLRIAEQAPWTAVAAFAAQLPRWPHKLWQAAGLFDASYRANSHVVEALGKDRLEGVRINRGGVIEEIACERLACGFGLIPNLQLAQALHCHIEQQAVAVDSWQASSVAGVYAAGEACGFGGSDKALVEGAIAGYAAVGHNAAAEQLWPQRQRWQQFAQVLRQRFALTDAVRQLAQPDTLVCRCEDVPYAALAGASGWAQAKLSSRCGMGACQGRVCGAAAQALWGWTPAPPRPPFSPTRIETLLQLQSPER
ncbi:FAD/NAD(P)-binding oxidoreductase [Pseudomonas sp. 5P_3.1_Bac2]|uniref:NAD(P)/FAD-dependent oxidoreductase n=1 Tax=Pseudomonas sp. 5P_3.1_Bac2 TaxID=2971617 RepID=UPI0021C604FB|nr:FAD/NAD(P)-binding oxidoreductase [Pseudomonas sp. 5P_3.1_Bac2]MCU1719214.1 NAD(P)/FAD-dependent oxidoreductase [Pseudomonas sp. 5P_3.1_Bac2]